VPKLVITGEQKKEDEGIPPRILTQYRRYIERLPEKDAAFLQFTPKEDINLGRKALLEAAAKAKKYIKVRKARGQVRTLQLHRCTKAEWDKSIKVGTSSSKAKTGKRNPRSKGSSAATSSAVTGT